MARFRDLLRETKARIREVDTESAAGDAGRTGTVITDPFSVSSSHDQSMQFSPAILESPLRFKMLPFCGDIRLGVSRVR